MRGPLFRTRVRERCAIGGALTAVAVCCILGAWGSSTAHAATSRSADACSGSTLQLPLSSVGTPTATASDCRIEFGSDDGPAQLRLSQSDGAGSAMWSTSRGQLDPTFGTGGTTSLTGGGATRSFWMSAPQRDGSIVAVGAEAGDLLVARYLPDGSLDPDFDGPSGSANGSFALDITAGNDRAMAVALQPDGRIVIAGVSGDAPSYVPIILRLLPDGSLDRSFAGDGSLVATDRRNASVEDMLVDRAGRIVIAGRGSNYTTAYVARFDADGTPDHTFGQRGWIVDDIHGALGMPAGTSVVNGIAIDSRGRLLATGSATDNATNGAAFTARYTEQGARDLTWAGGDGIAAAGAPLSDQQTSQDIAIDSRGRIIIVGKAIMPSAPDRWLVQRFTPDGQLDTSFNGVGSVEIQPGPGHSWLERVSLISDDQIVAAGVINSNLGVAGRGGLLKLDGRGVVDTRFGTSGIATLPAVSGGDDRVLDLQPTTDGALFVVGDGLVGGVTSAFVRRLEQGGRIDDYVSGTNDWDQGSSAFGACLRSTTGPVAPRWTPSPTCALVDGASWNAVPSSHAAGTSTITAATTMAGTGATASFRFGARTGPATPAGRYAAPLTFEVIAPVLEAPQNTVPPALSGVAQERRTLGASLGTWTGSGRSSFTRQWRRCNAAGAACVDIAGANGTSYTLTLADVGSTIRVAVTASSSEGRSTATSTQSASVTAWTPTITYNTGFEHNWLSAGGTDMFEFIGSDQSIVSSVSRNGGRALRNVSASPFDFLSIRPRSALVAPTSTMVTRFYLRVDRMPTAPDMVAQFEATPTNTQYGEFFLDSNGVLTSKVSSVPIAATTTLETHRWYRIDSRISTSAGSTTLNWTIDGVPQPTNAQPTGAITWGFFNIGSDDARGAVTYVDDMAFSMTAADYPLPEGQDIGYAPTGTGTHSPTTPAAGQSTNNFGACTAIGGGDNLQSPGTAQRIADMPPIIGGGADGICLTGTGGYVEYEVTNAAPTAGPPTAVAVTAAVRDSGGANELSITAASGGFTALAFSTNPTNVLQARRHTFPVAPDLASWSTGSFDALTLRASSSGATPNPRIDALHVEVDHAATPTASPIVPPSIEGVPKVGAAFTARPGTWTDPTAAFTYQWLRCTVAGESCVDIVGATGATFTPAATEQGQRVRVVVTASAIGGRQSQRSAATSVIGSAAPTLVHLDGFEHGTTDTSGIGTFNQVSSAAGGSAPQITSDVARSGTFALRSTTAGGAGGSSFVRTVLSPSTSIVVTRIAVLFDTLPTVRSEVMELNTSTGNGCRIWFDPTSNKLNARFSSGAGASGTSSAQVIEPWRWYVLDVRCDVSTGTKRLDMSVDSVPAPQATVAESATVIDSITVGEEPAGTASIGSRYYDDYAVSTTSADFPIGWGQVQPLLPDGTGAIPTPASFRWSTTGSTTCASGAGYTTFVAGDANEVRGRSELLDDWPILSGAVADRWCQHAAGATAEVSFRDANEAAAPNAVAILGAHREEAAGANTLTLEYGDTSGTWAPAYDTLGIDPGTTTEYRSRARSVRSNGAAWDPAALDALKVRLGASAVASGLITDALLAQYDVPTSTPVLPDGAPRVVLPYSVPKVGDELHVDDAAWADASGPLTRSWRWLRCDSAGESCSFIAGANGSTYSLQPADVGTRTRVIELGDDGDGAQVQRSTATAAVSTVPSAPEFLTGFEVGTYNAVGVSTTTGAAPSVTSTVAHSGSSALVHSPSGSQQSVARFPLSGAPSTVVQRVYFRMDAFPVGNPGSSQPMLVARNLGASDSGVLALSDAGRLFAETHYDNTAGKCTQTAGLQLEVNRWYLLDMVTTIAPSMLSVRWAVDGIEQPAPAVCTNALITSSSIDSHMLGPHGTQNGTWRYDDYLVTTTATDFPIGGGRIEALRPDGAGQSVNASSFTDDTGAAIGTAFWTRLTDNPMGPVTSYVRQAMAGANDYLETNLGDPVDEARARFVQGTIATHAEGAAGTNTFGWKSLAASSTEATAATLFSGDVGTTGAAIQYRRSQLPVPAAGWTFTELAGLRFHTGYATDVAPQPAVDALLAEVEYRE